VADRKRESQRAKARCAICTCCYHGRTEKMLSLSEAGWIALRTGEKFESEHGVRYAVERSRKRDVATNKRCRCNHRIILLIIGAAGGIAIVIRGWHDSSATTGSQCNSEAGIVVNRVAENGPFSVIASRSCDADSVEDVKCDNIAFA